MAFFKLPESNISVSPTPIQIVEDGINTQIESDNNDPNNNVEMPVKESLAIIDVIDAAKLTKASAMLDPSVNTIPRSSNNAVEIVSSLAAGCLKIKTVEDIGEFMALYSDAARASLICVLPLAGGELNCKIAQGTTIYIGAVNDSDINSSAVSLSIEFLG